MSTKTLRKRIALATVAVVGAGVLSLVSTSAANASNNVTVTGATTTSSAAAAADVLNIGTAKNLTGSALIPATTGDGTTASSVGLVNVSSVSGDLIAGTTQTAVLLSTGKLVVYTSSNTTSKNYTIVVSGGTLTASTTSTLVTAISGSQTSVASASAGIGLLAVSVTPNSGATSMTVSLYDAGATAASTSSPTTGTLEGQVTVSIVSSSTAGAVSTAKSGVWYSYNAATGLTSDDTTTPTEAHPTGGKGEYGIIQTADVRVRDAYGTGITSSAALLTATATNGAYVSLDGSTPAQSSAYYTGASGAFDDSILKVADPSNTPLSTTVTVSYNGTVIGTKSFTFSGAVAKVVLSAPSNGYAGSTGTATIAFADAANNPIYPSASSTQYPGANLSTDSSSLTASVTSGTVDVNGNGGKLWPTSSKAGVWAWSCSSTAGAGVANVVVKYVNNDGSVIASAPLAVSCSGAPDTYSATLDKSTYAPGDIAKLTVAFKDSKGNSAADFATNISASGTSRPSLTGGNLSLIGGADSSTGNPTDTTTNGSITYKFVVGAPTTDPYNGQLVVSFPVVNANDGSAQTIAYKIASGSTSLNDVLKGIVALIASINKQIAALAKLVTKKK